MAAAHPSGSEPHLLPCWQCKEANPPAFFCPHCDAVQQLPSNSNFSSLLGFGGGPLITQKELEERYYALSRRLHPDRFQTGTPQEQRASVQATALLNEAFRTLKNIEDRGRWWLAMTGESLGKNNNRVPASLAVQVFAVQEKVADLPSEASRSRDQAIQELRTLVAGLQEQRKQGQKKVEKLLRGWPVDIEADSSCTELKAILSELSYLKTLVRDVGRALEE